MLRVSGMEQLTIIVVLFPQVAAIPHELTNKDVGLPEYKTICMLTQQLDFLSKFRRCENLAHTELFYIVIVITTQNLKFIASIFQEL